MRRLTLAAALIALTAPAALAQTPEAPARGSAPAPVHAEDAVLAEIIAADTRTPANAARDQYRRPYEALTFWGLRPGLTVVEIEPGGAGWWTEILAPYAERTGGEYIAAWIDRRRPTSRTAPARPVPGWSRNCPPMAAWRGR